MPMNGRAAADQLCPGIRIQAIDIVQPPGIGIPPVAGMDAHQATVAVALAAKRSAETLKKSLWETRSKAIIRDPAFRGCVPALIAAQLLG
jgi:hypothetical protein